ncbi:HET-domain-containing protein [Nemania serpens]|nr:HET-domain-containing protein [Nemania serpens]
MAMPCPNPSRWVQEMISKLKYRFKPQRQGGTEPGAEVISHSNLHNSCIKKSTIPHANPAFLPVYWHSKFLNENAIRKTLTGCKKFGSRDIQRLVDYAKKESKVFLTLAFIDRVEHIDIMCQNKFTDAHLPIRFEGNFETVTSPNGVTEDAAIYFPKNEWGTAAKEQFQDKQWVFLAPRLVENKFLYNLHADQPLPFKPVLNSNAGSGHFGTVYKVEIPSSHFNNQETNNFNGVAVKYLGMADSPEKSKFFEKESKTLETMRKLNHPHLIQAYSAYSRGQDKGFVFPFANGGDLAAFWKEHEPNLDANGISWALMQMKGLASGIKALHDKKTRHGDIKPQNILIFNSTEPNSTTLVIADVGIAKFHAIYTRQRHNGTTTPFGSRRYEPPEVEDKDVPQSRKYDMWSLGCVLLEFIIWLVSGAKGFDNFIWVANPQKDDRLWEDREGGSVRSVRLAIAERMTVLKGEIEQKGQLYAALNNILSVIREQLLIELDKRADSTKLLKEIDGIYSRYLRDYHDSQPLLQVEKTDYVPTQMEGANTALSGNRTSQFDDKWTVMRGDKSHASNSRLRLGVSLNDQLSVLCESCRTLDPKAADILLDRGTEKLQKNSDKCELCNLLSQCLLKRNLKYEGSLQLIRDHSTIKIAQDKSPLLSIYSHPDSKIDTSNYTQPELPILPDVGSDEQFELMREWIRSCDAAHECYPDAPTKMPSRVIDVGEEEDTRLFLLISSSESVGRYAALSHCWGQKKQQSTDNARLEQELDSFTERKTFEAFKKEIILARLPKTFQDAVRTTRALGIRYLWIDSLCIIQDDKEDWESESKKMENVYSCAYVTIAASSATSSRDGFLVDRPARVFVTTATSDGPIYLAEAIDDFKGDVEDSVLNTRGWVLQERALSRRTIHFTSTQVYWECGRCIKCETLTQLSSPKQSQFLGDSNFPTFALEHFKDQRIRFIQHLYTDYCARKLTKQTDRRVAISGLEKRIGHTLQTRASYGIVWKFFQRSILWRARKAGTMSRIDYGINEKIPSWSWMAYSGEISYMEIPFGVVKWTDDLQIPYEPQFENPDDNLDEKQCIHSPGRPMLAVAARGLTIKGSELFKRVILDRDIMDDFDSDTWKCVRVGRDKTSKNTKYYVILIRREHIHTHEYERIGAGVLLPTHFSFEGEFAWLI